jgi:excisionase family DNA binding protein
MLPDHRPDPDSMIDGPVEIRATPCIRMPIGTEERFVNGDDDQKTLSTGDLVTLVGVSRTTIHRWAVSGLLPSFKTLGGHHRFIEAEVMPILRRRGVSAHHAGSGG